MNLTPQQIYGFARKFFPKAEAVTMTAIALRESGGDPSAYNGDAATGDRSYGLWQINLKDPNVYKFLCDKFPEIRNSEQWLLVPENNAAAAAALWAGNNKNLDVAWYINHGGDYQARYEAHLPVAQACALAESNT